MAGTAPRFIQKCNGMGAGLPPRPPRITRASAGATQPPSLPSSPSNDVPLAPEEQETPIKDRIGHTYPAFPPDNWGPSRSALTSPTLPPNPLDFVRRWTARPSWGVVAVSTACGPHIVPCNPPASRYLYNPGAVFPKRFLFSIFTAFCKLVPFQKYNLTWCMRWCVGKLRSGR